MNKLMLGGDVAQTDNHDATIQELRSRVRQLEVDLATEKARSKQTLEGAAELKLVLTPLYKGLRHIFGEFDAIGVQDVSSASSGGDKKLSAAWESWKKKLGGKAAMAIDVLFLHGEMNATQLRIHLQCGNDYVYNVISQLHKAGIINKNGGKISLKGL